MGALWTWVLRDERFDGPMLRRQREALLGYTNLTCRVPALRTAAPLKTEGAAAIEESVGPAEDALPANGALIYLFEYTTTPGSSRCHSDTEIVHEEMFPPAFGINRNVISGATAMATSDRQARM